MQNTVDFHPKTTIKVTDMMAFERMRQQLGNAMGMRHSEHFGKMLQSFTSAAWSAMRAAVDHYGSTLPLGWMVAARIDLGPQGQFQMSHERQYEIQMIAMAPGDHKVPDPSWSLFARPDPIEKLPRATL